MPYVPHLVTGVRLICTPLLIWAVCHPDRRAAGWAAVVLFALIAVSDVLDGTIARRLGMASEAGRQFDHLADIVFVLATLGTYVGLGVAPWWVPASVAISFAAYAVDSRRYSGADGVLRGLANRTGHLGGVANYVLIGVLVGNETLGLHVLPPVVIAVFFGAVPLYCGAAVALRFVGSRGTLEPRGRSR